MKISKAIIILSFFTFVSLITIACDDNSTNSTSNNSSTGTFDGTYWCCRLEVNDEDSGLIVENYTLSNSTYPNIEVTKTKMDMNDGTVFNLDSNLVIANDGDIIGRLLFSGDTLVLNEDWGQASDIYIEKYKFLRK